MKRRVVEIGCVALLALLAAFTAGFFVGSAPSRAPVRVETVPEVQPVLTETASPETDSRETEPASQGPVNLNTATLEELMTLPGIGEVLAQRILDYRAACGPFLTAEQITEVEGIGEKRFEALKDWITVEETNENSGS